MKKCLVVLVGFVLFCFPLSAQQNSQRYMEETGVLSTLYRGKLPVQYPYLYNGTYFWESKTFREGSVYYNGKLYDPVYVNIDASRQELQVKTAQDKAPVVLYEDLVSYFTMGDRLFVNLRYLGYPDAPEGYFEVVRDSGSPLLVQVKKVFSNRPGDHNGTDIGYTDYDYDNTIVNFFEHFESYYTVENGQVKKISRRAYRKALKQPAEGNAVLRGRLGRWKGTDTPAPVSVEEVKLEGIGLPDGYFQEIRQEADASAGSQTNVTVSYRNKVYVIGNGNGKGPVKVTGQVSDMETGDMLPGVVVFDENTSTYARTDAQGRYSITLPSGNNVLHFSMDAKEDMDVRVELRSDGVLNIELPDRVEYLKASVVSAQSMAAHRTAEMGVETVNIRTMNKIPSAFGEGDILKAVLTLPGVKTVGEASGGFNVRGGSQDQNLILYNGNTIYNPSHLFGIFSAFNPDLVEDVQLYKSSIPAQYGGRISSVLTVSSKEGSQDRLRGSLGIGLLTSRAHLEGPLGSEKTTFILGGRTTYSDWLLGLLPKNSYYSGGSAGFTDVNAGITHRFSKEDALQLSGYFATDRFAFSGDTSFRYTNLNVSAQFRHKEADGTAFQLSAGYDQFSNVTGIHDWAEGAYDLTTNIRQIFLRGGYTKPIDSHALTFGLDAVGYGLDPGILSPFGDVSRVVGRSIQREYAVEPALYLSDDWKLTEQFSLEGGVRLSSFLFMNPSKFYLGPEFRLSARYSPVTNLSFKAGFNTMRQYIHLISNTSSVSPMDTWKLSDASLAPTTGWQAAGGVYWTHLDTGIDFSVEGYWKQMQNCLDYKPGATLSMNEHLADDLLPVYGKAYGIEAMIKKTTGSLTGWISYCYSRSQYREMLDRGHEAIAGGNWYNAPYDKPHEVKVVANWAMTHRFSLSANLDYSTGRPVTVPVGKYYLSGLYRLAYSERNSYRIPDYFRLDLAFNIDPGHYKKALFHTTFTIGVYNVTGRKNPYSVFFKADQTGYVQGYMLSVFASPIPYVNINFLF